MPEPRVIAPNLKRTITGVSRTVIQLVPQQSPMIEICALGPGLPPAVAQITFWQLLCLRHSLRRVWHARRNTEMLLGLVLKHGLRYNFRLVFTSAAQRPPTWFKRWLMARMDALVAPSPQAARVLARPAQLIRHGVDTNHFHPAANKAQLRQALGLPKGFLIGCFGRIRPSKGSAVLVSAALQVLPAHPHAHVVFVGRLTRPFKAFWRQQQRRIAAAGLSGRILYLGERPDAAMAPLHRALDLLVAPAIAEGFGLTPLEAMASGVPALATGGVGAFSAQIKEGATGWLVPADDSAALAGVLSSILADTEQLEGMGDAARAHVQSHFSLAQEAQALVELYRALLADSRPG